MTTDPQLQPDTIWRLRTAIYPAIALLAGIQLDLFTALGGGPRTVENVTDALGIDSDKLRPLLYILVELGLLAVDGELFSNNPEANQFLVKGKSSYIGAVYEAHAERWNAVWKTAESIRVGSAQAKVDYAAMSAEELEAHYQSFHLSTLITGKRLLAEFDFSSSRSIIDVAGGTGGVAIAIAQACPHIRATVVDFPSVIPIAQRFIQEAGVADRVEAVAADVVNGPLEGSFDVALVSRFIPVISRDDAQRALRNIGQVMEPGGTLYMDDGGTLDNSRLSPTEVVWQNLWYINIFDEGQARTEQERRVWLTHAGFEGIERFTFPDGDSIIVARKSA